ncbi:hypothetical protein [Candidatus Symbiobacter mobilis]|uniref:Uncharacterized protein n=1 Tax=Candidatus Symbiobacter mobilis CR TaxID=946483 RepID=U5NBS5_9BURK|nr:hypothetical protein [Candidatus Symbiobacter mobilis]AGX87634.1 hypothetical protein Cenrod_1549 [Candidatus Symbiobacter mobilis CR]
MRALCIPLLCALSGLVFATEPVSAPIAPTTPTSPTAPTSPKVEKRTERIHVEDTATRIDELRVGGETQTITVQPKSSMPAYQIAPKTGERSWKVLGF